MLLPWLILIPFIGGLLAGRLTGSVIARWIATMGITLILSVQLWLEGITLLLIHKDSTMAICFLCRGSRHWELTFI